VANASWRMSGKPDPEGNAQKLFAPLTHPATLRLPTSLLLRNKEVNFNLFYPLFAACGREGGRAEQDRVSSLQALRLLTPDIAALVALSMPLAQRGWGKPRK